MRNDALPYISFHLQMLELVIAINYSKLSFRVFYK